MTEMTAAELRGYQQICGANGAIMVIACDQRGGIRKLLARAGISRIVEIWCHAPPDVIGERYVGRIRTRSKGHLGAEYVPELVDLAKRAKSLGRFPLIDVDTTKDIASAELLGRIRAATSSQQS